MYWRNCKPHKCSNMSKVEERIEIEIMGFDIAKKDSVSQTSPFHFSRRLVCIHRGPLACQSLILMFSIGCQVGPTV